MGHWGGDETKLILPVYAFVRTVRAGISLSHLIWGPGGVVVVDTGLPGNQHRIMAKLRILGCTDVCAIFITHAHMDHYGSAAALQRLTGAPIAIHRQDAAAMAKGVTLVRHGRGRGWLGVRFLRAIAPWVRIPTVADWVLDDGQPLPIPGWQAAVVHTPGHSAGSSTLWVNQQLAFVGDLMTWHRHQARPQQLYADNWDQIEASMQRVRDLHPVWVYPSHGHAPLPGSLLSQPSDSRRKCE